MLIVRGNVHPPSVRREEEVRTVGSDYGEKASRVRIMIEMGSEEKAATTVGSDEQ